MVRESSAWSKKKEAGDESSDKSSSRSNSRSVIDLKVDHAHQLQQQEQQQREQQQQLQPNRVVRFTDQIQGLCLFDQADSSPSSTAVAGVVVASANSSNNIKNKKQINIQERRNKFIQAIDKIIMMSARANADGNMLHGQDKVHDLGKPITTLNDQLSPGKEPVISVDLEDDDDILLPDQDASKILNSTPSSSLNCSTTISIGFKKLTSDRLNQRMIQRLIESDEHRRLRHLDDPLEKYTSDHHYDAIQPINRSPRSGSMSSRSGNLMGKEADLIPSLSSSQVMFASNANNMYWHSPHRSVREN